VEVVGQIRIAFLLSMVVWVFSCQKKEVSQTIYITGNGVTDVEGYTYPTVIIGDQEWMAENLKTDFFCNGNSIPSTGDSAQVKVYDDNPQNEAIYGKLYNYQAVLDTSGLCPCGWEVPTELDFARLIDYLGGYQSAMIKMKSVGFLDDGTGLWDQREPVHIYLGDNSSGFNAVPGGIGFYDNFYDQDSLAAFWAIPETGTKALKYQIFNPYVEKQTYAAVQAKEVFYFSVRCIKSIQDQ
jgi:uncharacterized protein (TIGR02145 family)